jgi:hypothetical protein
VAMRQGRSRNAERDGPRVQNPAAQRVGQRRERPRREGRPARSPPPTPSAQAHPDSARRCRSAAPSGRDWAPRPRRALGPASTSPGAAANGRTQGRCCAGRPTATVLTRHTPRGTFPLTHQAVGAESGRHPTRVPPASPPGRAVHSLASGPAGPSPPDRPRCVLRGQKRDACVPVTPGHHIEPPAPPPRARPRGPPRPSPPRRGRILPPQPISRATPARCAEPS